MINERELATVLAALRYWQTDLEANDGEVIDAEHFQQHSPLTVDEIDKLCERLNLDDSDHPKSCPCRCHRERRLQFFESLCKCNTANKDDAEREAVSALHFIRMEAAGEGMKTDREALEAIRDYPANGNSEPDVMAEAVEAMQAIAAAQLEGDDWDAPEGGDHES